MNNEIIQTWNATLYLRLSREDGDKEESNSITGQRELLRDYLKAHPELHEYAVRVDDGFSGSTFERPAFQAMLNRIIRCIEKCIAVSAEWPLYGERKRLLITAVIPQTVCLLPNAAVIKSMNRKFWTR